jgi:type IV pilus assembly protein PilQ
MALLVVLACSVSAPSARAAGRLRYATDITVQGDATETRVVVSFSARPTFTARLERKGARLIVDVPDSSLRGAPSAITRSVGLVGGIMAQGFKSGRSRTTRILVSLLQPAQHSVVVDGKRLVIRLRAPGSGPANQLRDSETKRESAARRGPRVLDVGFGHATYQDQIEIKLSAAARYTRSASGGRSRLILRGATLPRQLARTLDVGAFMGPVTAVSSYQDPQKPGRVIIEVEHSNSTQSQLDRRGSTLLWRFYEPGRLPFSVTGVAPDGGIARRTRTVHVEKPITGLPPVATGFERALQRVVTEREADPERAGAFTPAIMAQADPPARRYAGRRIDLDLKDADVHNVLRLLADVGRINIVTADDVSGTVTIRMRNVPWDQALDVILQSKGLGKEQRGNMIRVAPLEQLEKEREMRIARQKQELQLAPLETRLIPVSYADAGDVQARARELLSARGSIAVDDRTNVMIVRDVAGNLNQVEELTRSLDTQTPQVLIEARIVEATSRYLRDVGIQWGGDATFSAATGNPTGLAFPNSVGVVGGASDTNTPTAGLSPFANQVQNPNFAVNLPATVGTGQGGALGLTFGSVNNTINLAVRLSAAESSGMLRILSSPRILTLDNKEARISQGTLIPFSQISAQGVQTTFQEAKLQLLVKPHVTADGSVSMQVKINRDEPDFNQTSPRGDPTILKREAETHLLVMDGHTAVIGGIFTRNTGRNLDQVPFFGDIPILGLLFQRRRASDSRGELVIFLTPRIVNRAEALGR